MPKTLRAVLDVAEFDQVVAFYRDLLGWPVVGGWDRGPQDRGALVQVSAGGVLEVVGHGPDHRTPRNAGLVLAVELDDADGVDALHRRLREAGVPTSAPVRQPWGHYSASLRDPVGTEIVLYAELTGR